jgi:basic amino acid/polyamine antiporter, APA family
MYAELMSRYPTNGSAFGFFYATFGELPAWLVGWYLLPRYGAVSAALARAMTSYLAGLLAKFGISFPTILSSATLFGIDECCPMAVVFLYILCGINCLGSKESQLFNTVLTISKIGTLILIIIVGFTRF